MRARRQRRQVGARHVAWMRGAFRGGQARPRNSVAQPANPEPDGATRAARARNSGVPCTTSRVSHTPGPDFRDLTCEAATAGRMAAQFA
jgi:hypothetical protein